MNLDLTQVHVGGADFEPIPSGDYDVVCKEAKIKQTKAGTGEYISATFEVVSGPHDGRLIFENFNIKNQNPQAVQIALEKIKGFLTCAGVKDPNKLNDVNDLCGLKAVAHVKIKKDETHGDKNVINYFKPLPTSKMDNAMDALMGADIPF